MQYSVQTLIICLLMLYGRDVKSGAFYFWRIGRGLRLAHAHFPRFIPVSKGTMLLVVGDIPSTARHLWWPRESRDLPALFFRGAHRGRVCLHVLIVWWVCVRVVDVYVVPCNSKKTNKPSNRVVILEYMPWRLLHSREHGPSLFVLLVT
jgi:hypothetical protein